MNKVLYLGMPGSGKTTTLINLLEKELKKTPANRIAYVSFTKKAIHEAQDRALKKFDLKPKDMPFFKTLHSLAFSSMGLTKGEVVSQQHLKDLGNRLGVKLCDKDNKFSPLNLYNLARVKNQSLHDVWKSTYLIHTKTFNDIQYVISEYKQFKKSQNLVDFTDMIMLYNKQGSPFPVDVAFIDEAQDLATIQWMMIDKCFINCKKLFFAGDDDQCIYSWSGADKRRFFNFEGEKIILNNSYRCPQVVCELANKISDQIHARYKKELVGTAEKGSINHLSNLIDNKDLLNNGEQWMILVRNRSDFHAIKTQLIYCGLSFTINGNPYAPYKHYTAILGYQKLLAGESVEGETAHVVAECAGITKLFFKEDEFYSYENIFGDREKELDFRLILVAIYKNRLLYYANALLNGQDLKNPKIHLTTIHGAKGSECDNVIISCDQSLLTYKSAQHSQSNEHRVFYVGVTRAKKNLYLLQVKKQRHYKMPKI